MGYSLLMDGLSRVVSELPELTVLALKNSTSPARPSENVISKALLA